MEKFNISEFRASGITNLDAPTLYGLTPNRSETELWLDKASGTDNGPEMSQPDFFLTPAQKLVEERFPGLDLKMCCFRNSAMPFFIAEEILADVDRGMIFKIAQEPILTKTLAQVSNRHWVELHHARIASGCEKAFFVSTVDGRQISIVEVSENSDFTTDHIKRVIEFWDYVRRGVELPKNEAPETAERVCHDVQRA